MMCLSFRYKMPVPGVAGKHFSRSSAQPLKAHDVHATVPQVVTHRRARTAGLIRKAIHMAVEADGSEPSCLPAGTTTRCRTPNAVPARSHSPVVPTATVSHRGAERAIPVLHTQPQPHAAECDLQHEPPRGCAHERPKARLGLALCTAEGSAARACNARVAASAYAT